MAGTLVKRVFLQIRAEDGDTEAKLDKISAKADELAAKHPEMKVRIDTAAASAKVAVLRQELRGLAREADAEAAKGGILSRFLGGFGKFGGGFGSIFGKIPGLPDLGGAGSAGGEAGGGGGLSFAGSATALGVLVPAIGAALVELDGLVSGFAAAGAGAGAFGLLALPAFKKVSGAVQQISADQQAYDRALTTTAKNNALKHLRDDYAALDPSERAAVQGIQGLTREFGKLATAFEPQVFKIFADVLKIANQLLPSVVPFANAFARALGGLLTQVDRFTASKGFKDWLAQFEKLVGPAVTAIGVGVGHLAVNFGKLLTIMSQKDIVNAINIAFSILDGTLIVVGGTIRVVMRIWDRLTTQFDQARGQVRGVAHDIAGAFDFVRHAVAHDVDSIVQFFESLPRRIMGAIAALPGLLWQAGANMINSLTGGLMSRVGSVIGAISNIVGEVRNFLPFSPAKRGPLSGSGSPDIAGRRIGLMLAEGMRSAVPSVTLSAAHIARAAHPGLGLAGAAGGYGGTLRIEWVGGGADQEFLTWLKKHIRIRGGDPGVIGR